MLGGLHLQVGDLPSAEDVFERMECLVPDADGTAEVRMSRGFLEMARGEYSAAHAEFDAALVLQPSNTIAANNRAVALLYLCRVADAITSLEDHLRRDPVRHVETVLVSNLAAMYELQSDNAAAHRRVLDQLVHMVAADDVIMATTQTGQRPGAASTATSAGGL
mmetsp:Transcript_11657/g.31423  ORF Transcript_11657/g.31423 Transcript_11657/m.31423 type:complete len:164 (-) Transcript_11657:161-652(-)